MVCVKINGKTFERTVNYISVCGGSELTQVSVALSSGFLPDYKHRHSNEILLAPYVEVNTEFMKIVARRMKVKYVTIIQSIMFRLFIYLTTCFISQAVASGVPVARTCRVLSLRMEETASNTERSCVYIE
jgi:hypothetical protein